MKRYLIWSVEHAAWWGPNHTGYTTQLKHAGHYTLEEATKICEDANIWLFHRNEKGNRQPMGTIVPVTNEL